jgi:hypothetical protein
MLVIRKIVPRTVLFMNQILINNRSSISNRPLKFAKSQNLGLNYTINDLFTNLNLVQG